MSQDQKQDLVSIEIDGRTIEAPKGAMLIDVADDADIRIPRFCYHKKLSVAANCRMCLVEVEKAPKPLPACATPVMDGMKVYTQSPLALRAQKGTMEFLLINHPLDCPICDQGGECELQDVAMGYGDSVSKYTEAKRVVKDKDIGPLIETEMTRCIHCTRCVRFGEEIAGVRELGATGRGEHMRIGTYVEKTVAHELSGNVIDLCPVGALTAKPSRYTARAWELSQAATIAPHDAVGSNLYLHTYDGRAMRVVPRDNEAVNETWISDRDRFSYTGLYAEDRLTCPRMKVDGQWQDVSWETALSYAVEGLKEIAPERIGALLSPSLSVEEHYLAQKVLRGMGVVDIDHRLDQVDFSDESAAPLFPYLGVAISDLEDADAVLLVGCNPRREQPLLAHRLRKAASRGARVSLINDMLLDLTYPVQAQLVGHERDQVMALAGVAGQIAAAGKSLPKKLEKIVKDAESRDADTRAAFEHIAKSLLEGKQGHVLLGQVAIHGPAFGTLRALAGWIAKHTGARLGYLPAGANAAGAWLAGVLPHRGPAGGEVESTGNNAAEMIAEGREAFVIAGIEPGHDGADPVALRATLEKAGFVVALSAFASADMEAVADVLLPVATSFENSGTFVNVEGRWQSYRAAARAPEDVRPGWKVWRVLGNLLDQRGMDYLDSRAVRDELKGLLAAASFDTAVNMNKAQLAMPEPIQGDLYRVQAAGLYSTDALVRRAEPLQTSPEGRLAECVMVHPESAGGLDTGSRVKLRQDGAETELTLILDDAVPVGLAVTFAGSTAMGRLGAPNATVTLARA
ncbi:MULTISPECIES: NADH-quinone oxidoreductase subunit NuoG [unclassified Thioalkalivibrio]|uniref:NADH-quinone oxidoreductase subunit NuoG n=1 Tax=unclassified Thioalkalivibrio TaxID=2621013 RepID=UPI000376452C|nr:MULTISPECIES: NADH-quinone oxidoreductase subunit NuoG [unclassified Thioalkalivibrio]